MVRVYALTLPSKLRWVSRFREPSAKNHSTSILTPSCEMRLYANSSFLCLNIPSPATTLLAHLRETCCTRLPAQQCKPHCGRVKGRWLRGQSPTPETGHARRGCANGCSAGVCNLAAVQLQRLQHHEACVCTWFKHMSLTILLSLGVHVGGRAREGTQNLAYAYTSQTHCYFLHALVSNRVVTKLEGREVGERLLAFEGLAH